MSASQPETHTRPSLSLEAGVRGSVFGKVRKLNDLNKKEKTYVVLSGLVILTTIGLSIYKITIVSKTDPDLTFAIVLILNALICTFYAVHGVLKERQYAMVIFMIAIFIISIYCVANYCVQIEDRGPVKLPRLIIVCIMSPPLIGLTCWISCEYCNHGKMVFRTIGCNPEFQCMYKMLLVFLDCLKLDLQLGITMVILILNSGLKINTEDIVILSVGGVITLARFLVGYFSVRHENKVGSWIFIIVAPAEPAYAIFKMIQSKQESDTAQGDLVGVTIAAGVIAIVIRITLMVLLYFVYRNYGKGLKEKYKRSTDVESLNLQGQSNYGSTPENSETISNTR
ncbi:hypothetical protein SNE40_001312 [Patella caerulea]|uniref:DUF7789 domain-containing protein n=1 Tax=Patella caerulea TaxID=87958 RepID=A0AAN8Q3D0_PATCE